jgi:hypothetical protein
MTFMVGKYFCSHAQPNPACAAELRPEIPAIHRLRVSPPRRVPLDDSNFLTGRMLEDELLPRIATAFGLWQRECHNACAGGCTVRLPASSRNRDKLTSVDLVS